MRATRIGSLVVGGAVIVACVGDGSGPWWGESEAIIGPGGGAISVPLIDGVAIVDVPAGAVVRPVRIRGRRSDRTIPGAASPVIELEPDGLTFAKPVTLQFHPGERDLPEWLPPNSLAVATVPDRKWEFLPTAYLGGGVVEGRTTHFSPFALVAPCHSAGTGTDFQLVGCPALNPRIESSAPVTIDATAGTIAVRILLISSGTAAQTDFRVSGLQAGGTYWLHVDEATGGSTQLLADASGAVRFAQDLSQSHLVLVSSAPGSLLLTASSCVPPVGTFNAATSTCFLTRDLPDANVSIGQDALTLDCRDLVTGKRHAVGSTAARRTLGVLAFRRTGVKVRNCDLVNVDFASISTESTGFAMESVTAAIPPSDTPGGNAFDDSFSKGNTYQDVSADNYLFGVVTVASADLAFRRAILAPAAVAVRASNEDNFVLEDVTVEGSLSTAMPPTPTPSGAVQLSSLRGGRVLRLTAKQTGATASALLVSNSQDVAIRGTEILGARDGVFLDTTARAELTDSTVTGAAVGLRLLRSTALVFHNNLFGNSSFQVFSDGPALLFDVRAVSPTFQHGNFWGRVCPQAFVPGTDSNRLDVVDRFPYEVMDGWIGGVPGGCGCVQPLPPPTITSPLAGACFKTQTPTFTGRAEANATVTIQVDGTLVATAVAAADGSFAATPTAPLADGLHTATATATAHSASSAASAVVPFIVASVPPAAPTITVPTAGMVTFDAFLPISGNATSGTFVRVVQDSVTLGTVFSTGTFFFLQPFPLAPGTHTVFAVAKDCAGNLSPPSAIVSFTVEPISLSTPLIGGRTVNGLLRITSMSDAPDPFALDTAPPNTLTATGEIKAVQGQGGSSPPLQFSVVIRREFFDPITGKLVATVVQESTAARERTAGTLVVSGQNIWDGRDASGRFVAPGTYTYSVQVAVTRKPPGQPGASPDCVNPWVNLNGPCLVDVTPAVFGAVVVLPPMRPFGAPAFLTAPAATQSMGQDCRTFGASACVSGLCLHYKPSPDEGYACTARCQSSDDCPFGWSCAAVFPGPGNEVCIPPEGWVPAVAAVRPATQPPPR